MPIWKQWKFDGGVDLAVWKIEEEISFFSSRVPSFVETRARQEHKQKEFLASRMLLGRLYSGFDFEKVYVENRKPKTTQDGLCFSISHSFPFVGVVLGRANVGLDVQRITPKVLGVRKKFLNEGEASFFDVESVLVCTILWSIKEAVYKLLNQSMPFYAEQIAVEKVGLKTAYGVFHEHIVYYHTSESLRQICVRYFIAEDFVLCYTTA